MKVYYVILSLILSIVYSKQKKKRNYVKENNVLILNDANFNSTIKRFKHLIVEFTANWCGKYCKDVSNDLTKVAIRLSKHKPKILFARINLDENTKTHSIINIRRYPTLYYYERGVQYNYTGVLSEVGMLKWALKRISPPLIKHNILSEISNFKNTHEITLVYFGNDTDILSYLRNTSTYDQDMFYSYCTLQTALTQYSVNPNTIIIFRDYGEERSELSGKITVKGLERFIEKNGKTKLLGFNDNTAQMIWQEHKPGLFILRDPNSQQAEALNRIAKSVADRLYGEIKVVLGEIEKRDEYIMKDGLFATPNDLPAVRIVDTRNNKRLVYLLEDIVTEKNIISFYDDWTKGKLHPHLKSEDIPKEQVGDVFKVVSKTYDKEVINAEMNVLVLYYSFNIDACKDFMPTYEIFASVMNNFNKDANLRVAQIDIKANEIENFEERSFPHLKLFIVHSSSGKIIKSLSNVKNDLNELIQFVEQNLNITITMPKENKGEGEQEQEQKQEQNKDKEPIKEDL